MPQLTFDICGGVGQNYTTFLPSGESVAFPNPNDPIHPKGAKFLGWGFTPIDVPYTSPTIAIFANTIMYALWEGLPPEVDTYEFTFKPNGANGEKYSVVYPAGEMAILPTTTTFVHPAGYKFVGWTQKAETAFTIKQVLTDEDKTLYAVWEPAGSGGGGGTDGKIGYPSGKTIRVQGFGPMSRLPVTTGGYVLANEAYPGWVGALGDSNIFKQGIYTYDLHYTDPETGVDSRETAGLRTYKLAHPDTPNQYDIRVSNQNYGHFAYKDYTGPKLYAYSTKLSQIVPDSVPGKTFLGWTSTYNSDSIIETTADIPLSMLINLVPVHRKGEPQFNVTIDANDGTGQNYKIEKIRNELFYADYSVLSLVSPKKGKVLRGLSLSPTGAPKIFDYFLINKNTTLYCIWANMEDNPGLGTITGKTIPVQSCPFMSKMPVTSEGILPFMSLTPPCEPSKIGEALVVNYTDPETGQTKQETNTTYSRDIKLQHPENISGYSIIMYRSTTFATKAYRGFGGLIRTCPETKFLYFAKLGIGAPNKEFKGVSNAYNSDVVYTEELADAFTNIGLLVPVVREGEPQFNVTIDANDGSGQSVTFENIENELFYVNYDIEDVISPQEGKVFCGLSRIPDGEPLMYDYFLINKDTTLYCIWADE